MLTRTALLAVSATAALATLPAAASAAPSLSTDSACYVQSGSQAQNISATIIGLAANQSVAVRLTQAGLVGGIGSALNADAGGTLVNGLDDWSLGLGSGPQREKSATVEAIDTATGTSVASAPISVANFDYNVTSKGHSHSWKIQGLKALTGSSTYYAHYFKGSKYKGKMKLGTAKGACGYLAIHTTRLTPFKNLGAYNLVIEASKKYDPNAPRFTGKIVVTYH